MYDPRAIANLILDAADRYGFSVSNLKLQKLLFFAHGRYLIENKQPLVKGAFEAWKHGPVHPLVYQTFKENEGSEIKNRAMGFHPVTREMRELQQPTDPNVLMVVDRTVLEFGRMSAGRLVGLTHVVGGPWQFTIEQSEFEANLGLRIKDDVIIDKFKSQLMILSDIDEGVELNENAPYS